MAMVPQRMETVQTRRNEMGVQQRMRHSFFKTDSKEEPWNFGHVLTYIMEK